ncbi:MAG: MBL fold metallo-hydrolase [Spirochaetales bacterium]|nr:MBL fold metallo-hydrolase [Spirochaetales bacterium]
MKNIIILMSLIMLVSCAAEPAHRTDAENSTGDTPTKETIQNANDPAVPRFEGFSPAEDMVPAVNIHYLGHSAFVLEFDNGITVLTDFGESRAYGLDSPIYEFDDLVPDIVTFSHSHPDHKRNGMTFPGSVVLTGEEDYNIDGLEITRIIADEENVNSNDNTGFLFSYKGLKILHIGDAQGLIANIRSDEGKESAEKKYAKRYDLLLLPVESTVRLINQTIWFIELLRPKRVIPMHYWSPAYKQQILSNMKHRHPDYNYLEKGSADYQLFSEEAITETEIQVISLEPAEYRN